MSFHLHLFFATVVSYCTSAFEPKSWEKEEEGGGDRGVGTIEKDRRSRMRKDGSCLFKKSIPPPHLHPSFASFHSFQGFTILSSCGALFFKKRFNISTLYCIRSLAYPSFSFLSLVHDFVFRVYRTSLSRYTLPPTPIPILLSFDCDRSPGGHPPSFSPIPLEHDEEEEEEEETRIA